MKIISFFFCLLLTSMGRAQLLKIPAGTDLTIASGTIFSADGLTLTPNANYTISNNTLTKATTISHAAGNPYISRVYQFANDPDPDIFLNETNGTTQDLRINIILMPF